MLSVISVAAATAIIGFDMLRDDPIRARPFPRRIKAIGLTGSAAALDTEGVLLIGNKRVATIFNSAVGAPLRDAHMYPINEEVQANEELHFEIIDAPVTNALNLALDVTPS